MITAQKFTNKNFLLYGIVHEAGVNNEISEKLKEDFEKMKASEVEELTEAFKAVKTQMATELEANVEIKGKLEFTVRADGWGKKVFSKVIGEMIHVV